MHRTFNSSGIFCIAPASALAGDASSFFYFCITTTALTGAVVGARDVIITKRFTHIELLHTLHNISSIDKYLRGRSVEQLCEKLGSLNALMKTASQLLFTSSLNTQLGSSGQRLKND